MPKSGQKSKPKRPSSLEASAVEQPKKSRKEQKEAEKPPKTKAPKVEKEEQEVDEGEEYEDEEDQAWDSEGDGEEEDADEEEGEEDIVVDFDFVNPHPDDFLQVKQFLRNYMDQKEYNISELTDIILGQIKVGTILKSDGNVFGFITAINLHRHKKSSFVADFKKHVLECSPNEFSRAKLKALFDDENKQLGLLISERMYNCPPQISYPLMKGIMDEIEWAQEDEETEELRKSFKFDNYIMLGSYHVELSEQQGLDEMSIPVSDPSSGKKKKKKEKSSAPKDEELQFWPKLEEELMSKRADFHFNYRIKQSMTDFVPTFEGFAIPHRSCMVISAEKAKAVLQDIATLVGAVADEPAEANK